MRITSRVNDPFLGGHIEWKNKENQRRLQFRTDPGRTLATAMSLFDNKRAAFTSWLDSPNRALGYNTPRNHVRTSKGQEEVRNLIGGLEHGIFQ